MSLEVQHDQVVGGEDDDMEVVVERSISDDARDAVGRDEVTTIDSDGDDDVKDKQEDNDSPVSQPKKKLKLGSNPKKSSERGAPPPPHSPPSLMRKV